MFLGFVDFQFTDLKENITEDQDKKVKQTVSLTSPKDYLSNIILFFYQFNAPISVIPIGFYEFKSAINVQHVVPLKAFRFIKKMTFKN